MNKRLVAWGLTCALFYGFCLTIFHACADFGTSNELPTEIQVKWWNVYYLWQFVTHVLMMVVVCSINKIFMRLLLPMMIYSIIRLCLEAISIITGMEANNPLIVTILFIAALTACVYLSVIFLREKWKRNYS